ncbi:MAG TPA: biotin/lipoyl-containing protein, partial [Roseateles sp.]|nr:biotin/lipoyl-containing protein [Roseateles sp.]
MAEHLIKVPDLGEGIAEVELVAWHVQVGAEVAEDQALADVMTDKATVEIPSPVAGRVLSLGGAIGQVLAVGAELMRIEVAADAAQAKPAAAAPPPAPAPAPFHALAPAPPTDAARPAGPRPIAS